MNAAKETQFWPGSTKNEWEERAAIMEHEGRMPKEMAEQKAYDLIAHRAYWDEAVTDKILGLTFHEPWGSLVVEQLKPIENRRWIPPRKFLEAGGWLALHAGKTYDTEASAAIREAFPGIQIPMPAQGIIGVGRVVGWVEPHTQSLVLADKKAAPPSPADLQWHMIEQFGWLVRDVVKFAEPIPARGLQKLWPLRDLAPKVRAAYDAARKAA